MTFITKPKHLSFPIKHNPLKRIFDVFFSLSALILLIPIFILISFLIFFSSPGPVFYLSERLGRGGKIIKCIKFRTMYTDAEKKLHELLKINSTYKEEWDKYQKLKNDPRIIYPIGSFLRKTSMDELPQFINVLMGDLSIVGPRPFALIGPKEAYHKEIKLYLKDKTEKILSIRPGITGSWQTSGRSNITFEERLSIEEKYVDEQSFLKDLYLILKTILVIFFPKGAY
ncbi:MAG: sugar transferase [Chlamydiae bacterium]|nr:sugar transferase [Chlamydiota bacterium]